MYADIIKDLCSGQEVGVWKSYSCPACKSKKGRQILNIKVELSGVITYHCFSTSCELHGHHKVYIKNGNTPAQVKDRLVVEKREGHQRRYKLPENYVRTIPKRFLKYLQEYDIDHELINLYKIGYCHEYIYNSKMQFKDRLIIPTASGFLARSFEESPKWKNYTTNYDFKSINSNTLRDNVVVLVEDPVSCIKVGEVLPCVCLLGTSLKESQLLYLTKNYKKCIIFLDGDGAGIRGSLKVKKQLSSYLSCEIINVKGKDPKDLTYEELTEKLLN